LTRRAQPKNLLKSMPVESALSTSPFRDPRLFSVIRVYDEAGNVIETHEHKDDFKEP
jgi:hypothetical protein